MLNKLQSFEALNRSKKPIIYAVIKTDILSREKLSLIINTLSMLPNPVIWRGTMDDFTGQPPSNFHVDTEHIERIDVMCEYFS